MDEADHGWNKEQLFSSERQDWGTPLNLFDAVDREFHFTLDAAASPSNAKVRKFLTAEDDALRCDWFERGEGGSVWLNPPYGRGIGKWIEKAYKESQKGMAVVCLTFVRSDTKWWHDWAMKAAEVRLVHGRVTFEGASAGAPAPSCLLVFDEMRRVPVYRSQVLPRK